jgi:hypothetical protein
MVGPSGGEGAGAGAGLALGDEGAGDATAGLTDRRSFGETARTRRFVLGASARYIELRSAMTFVANVPRAEVVLTDLTVLQDCPTRR